MAWFEWGTDTTYGNSTKPQDIGSGTRVARVSAPLDGLETGGVYHFRLVASNAVAVTRGFDSIFTTGMRVQFWGSLYSQGRPAMPAGLTNLCGLASGHRHCLGIRNDGTVVVWMAGTQIYSYSSYGQTNVPSGLSNVVAVAGGFSHCLALKEEGTVVAWGKYGDGTPADVPANLTNVIAIAAGDYHSVALRSDGTVVAWGSQNSDGQTNVPLSLANVVAIACGSTTTLALKADGTIAWGGSGNLSSANGLVRISKEASYALGLRTNGTVVEGGTLIGADVPKPTNLSNVVGIATGNTFGEAVKADGTLVAWGSSREVKSVPPGLSNLVAIAGGDDFMVGLAPMNLPPYQLCSTSLSAAINQPKVISFCVYDYNGDPLTFRITSLPVRGSLYQYDPNGLGSSITAPGTIVTDLSRVIFVPAPNDYGSPYDSFSFVANDGELDSVLITYTISIPAPPQPRIEVAFVTNAPAPAFVLGLPGISNVAYSVWRSDDLNSWIYLGAATQAVNGQFYFSDSTISNSPTRFYRIQSP